MNQKTKDLVVKEETQVAAFVAPEFQAESVNVEDIAFPRIQLMQPISESVTDGKYAAGDIIDSVTGEIIGGTAKSVEIIPLRCRKYYKVTKKVDGKSKFVRIEMINSAQDMQKDWNFLENDEQMQRRPVMEVFVLVPGQDLPYMFRIAGMSYKGISKSFYTSAFALPASQRKAPFIRSLLITSKKEKNEKGTYFVYSFVNGKLSDHDTYAVANQWYEATKNVAIKEDNETDEEETTTKAPENCGF